MVDYLELCVDSEDPQCVLELVNMMLTDTKGSLMLLAEECGGEHDCQFDRQSLQGMMQMLAHGVNTIKANVNHCTDLIIQAKREARAQ
jgi:hypothetical protein